MRNRVITANRLIDGAVVWRDGAGRWRKNFNCAVASDDEGTMAAMLAAAEEDAASGVVIAPYEVEVDILPSAVSGVTVPTRLRERIRAFGPTVALR